MVLDNNTGAADAFPAWMLAAQRSKECGFQINASTDTCTVCFDGTCLQVGRKELARFAQLEAPTSFKWRRSTDAHPDQKPHHDESQSLHKKHHSLPRGGLERPLGLHKKCRSLGEPSYQGLQRAHSEPIQRASWTKHPSPTMMNPS
jgi:hypothetical protein